jgi:hypothetical protein
MHVLTVNRQQGQLVLTVESDADVGGCPACGVVAVGHGRRRRVVADAPVSGFRFGWCGWPDCGAAANPPAQWACSPNDTTWCRRGRS